MFIYTRNPIKVDNNIKIATKETFSRDIILDKQLEIFDVISESNRIFYKALNASEGNLDIIKEGFQDYRFNILHATRPIEDETERILSCWYADVRTKIRSVLESPIFKEFCMMLDDEAFKGFEYPNSKLALPVDTCRLVTSLRIKPVNDMINACFGAYNINSEDLIKKAAESEKNFIKYLNGEINTDFLDIKCHEEKCTDNSAYTLRGDIRSLTDILEQFVDAVCAFNERIQKEIADSRVMKFDDDIQFISSRISINNLIILNTYVRNLISIVYDKMCTLISYAYTYIASIVKAGRMYIAEKKEAEVTI